MGKATRDLFIKRRRPARNFGPKKGRGKGEGPLILLFRGKGEGRGRKTGNPKLKSLHRLPGMPGKKRSDEHSKKKKSRRKKGEGRGQKRLHGNKTTQKKNARRAEQNETPISQRKVGGDKKFFSSGKIPLTGKVLLLRWLQKFGPCPYSKDEISRLPVLL